MLASPKKSSTALDHGRLARPAAAAAAAVAATTIATSDPPGQHSHGAPQNPKVVGLPVSFNFYLFLFFGGV